MLQIMISIWYLRPFVHFTSSLHSLHTLHAPHELLTTLYLASGPKSTAAL